MDLDVPPNVEFEPGAMDVLRELQRTDPDIFEGVIATAEVLAVWEPGTTIKGFIEPHMLLKKSGFKVWRVKDKETLGEWRLFVFVLDGLKPPIIVIGEIVEYSNQETTYDNPSAPHVVRLRRSYLQHQTAGEIRR